ncbi:MAG: InlB B-repeat-containing protein [Bacilli bacterium]|nr:InlB B-repeat-containing protein [Bacilli bacterium]
MKKSNKCLLLALAGMSLAACGSNNPTPTSSQPVVSSDGPIVSSGSEGSGAASASTASSTVPTSITGIVEDIRIKTLPKTLYVLGEPFSIEGGVIELLYEGGDTAELPFTDSRVTVTEPNMETVGTKTVTVDYDGFIATYQITIKTQTYAVTFDLNYENAPTLDPVEVEAGGYLSKPSDPSRTDYKFLAWCTDKAGENEFDFVETVINANLTLYASWVVELSVQFDLGDGSTPKKVLVSVDSAISVQEAPSVLREGYQFLGWYHGEERYDFATTISSSLVLTAKWEAIPVGTAARKVTVDWNAGELYAPIQYYVADGAATFVPDEPIIEGKEFLGWYKAVTGADTFDFTVPITADTTIYAHYRVDFYTINFKYVANGVESIFRTKTVEPGQKVTTVIQQPRVEGYLFDGKWYSDKACTTLFDFNTEIYGDYDLYMKALKQNVFEAEYTYIDPAKPGVGSSDSFDGLKLIFEDNGTADASNGYWVSGLYNNGSFIEFIIESSKQVNDALLEARFSCEWASIYIAPETTNYQGEQNYYGFEIATYKANVDAQGNVTKDIVGYAEYDESTKQTVDYEPIALEGAIHFSDSMYDKRPFDTYLLTDKFVLYKGANVIRMTVRNSVSPYDGTMAAHAPMIDNMTIYTDSELSWSPHEENVSDWTQINYAPSKHGGTE